MHMSAESIKRRDSHQSINNIPKEQSSVYEYCFAQIHIQSRATLLITELSCPHLHWYSVQKGRTLAGVRLTEQCPNQTNYSCRTCRKLLSRWPRPVLVLDVDEF